MRAPPVVPNADEVQEATLVVFVQDEVQSAPLLPDNGQIGRVGNSGTCRRRKADGWGLGRDVRIIISDH
jgi:hypothetical protein